MISTMVRSVFSIVFTPIRFPPYYPEDTIITLADWYWSFCATSVPRYTDILTRYHVPSPAASLIPVADSTLINGLGRFAGGPHSPLAVINVSPGKSYRFRLISMSCDPNFIFSIDGHDMVSDLIWYRFIQADPKRRLCF